MNNINIVAVWNSEVCPDIVLCGSSRTCNMQNVKQYRGGLKSLSNFQFYGSN
jgi:hypothetical protein